LTLGKRFANYWGLRLRSACNIARMSDNATALSSPMRARGSGFNAWP
jgi:hypothetical protein